MDDLASLTAQPRRLRLGGKEYLLHRLTIDDFGALQEWINEQYPDPIELAAEHLDSSTPVAVQKHLLSEALALAAKPKPRIGMAEADALLQSVEGVMECLYLSIRKGDARFTRDEARKVFGSLSIEDIGRVMQATEVELVLSDPKAPSPGSVGQA